ncbi:LytTR family DNA-binding domain-containing protein [Sporosarcina sp. Te-1]|uniref:LytR/AlgR family response regulator transcription factor n=1 Tax=Sporosarcina sp. Te-1 TaxID=2818390 RepID=UPI001A9CFB23|nr:LytTR family DNA-binding domain-containing protein [Sporosarcina sp. Te-1]QTD42964.1 response regulator transcription factor [Sporosarcina sp. Te-1]
MKVVICEDDQLQREQLLKEIQDYASFHEPSIEVALCTGSPDKVLAYSQLQKADCYLLDIELKHRLDGMDIAMDIRQNDPLASIIFITTHADRLKLTFSYKLAALDFIVKDTPTRVAIQLREALQAAFATYKQIGQSEQIPMIQLEIGERIKNIKVQDIYYIETSSLPHKLTLYDRTGFYEFYGKLKDFEQLDPALFRCHKSFLINLRHVREVNKKERTVLMANGAICDVSFRLVRELQKRLLSQREDPL